MARYFPQLEEFGRVAKAGYEIIPVWRQMLADRLTPVMAFELLGSATHAFLLESVVGIEKIGRYSFIATSPRAVYEVKDGQAEIRGQEPFPSQSQSSTAAAAPGPSEKGYLSPFSTSDPLHDMERLLPAKKYYHDQRLPNFTGGLVGYAGYDTIRYYEGEKLTSPPQDDRHLPDVQFGLYGELVIFDHLDKTIKVVANAEVGAARAEAAYKDACARIDALVARLQQPAGGASGEIDTSGAVKLSAESNMTREQFEEAVIKGLEYIRAGDIFQFVPSQRLRVRSSAAPFDVYRALRVINPSPFMFYLKSPQCVLIGASPEILCRVQNGEVTSRPLAGTRHRGHSEAEDRALEKELLDDPKERAEHIMLVDLHRNDVGRVSVIGTVKVSDCMVVERYSHVMHITSNVSGMLEPGKTALDALRVSLPVGTVSGAPKIRAMQIIDELEPTRRGPYGGAVGYLDFSGNMDTCIALRTIVWMDGMYDVQVGAGVVADSEPAREWDETMNKAKALLKAVEIAQAGF